MSVILQWLRDSAVQFGLVNRTAKILVLGLENSGKSTLLFMLRNNRMVTLQPTLFPFWSEFTFANITYYSYDISGHKQGLLYSHAAFDKTKYYEAARDGIIFLVYSSDPHRFAEAKEELHVLLSVEALSNQPFLVLGTKTDAHGAVSEEELRRRLGLFETTGSVNVFPPDGTRPIELFMCSTVQRQGYEEGLQWLSQYVPYTYRPDA